MSARRLLSALVVSLGLLPAAAAEAGFAPTNETVVESEQLSASAPASDAAGNSIVAWSGEKTLGDPPEVKARRISAAGALGPVVELAPGEIGSRPAVAMTPSGRAFVAWEAQLLESDPRSVKGRWVEPDGTLGPILTLVEGVPGDLSAGGVLVVVDPAGVASVVWSNVEDFNRLALRRVQPDGTLGALVPDFSGGGVNGARIVALPDGSTAAVWRSSGIYTTTVDPSLTFPVPAKISVSTGPADPEIAVDGLGNALVVWRAGSGEYGTFAHRLSASGAPFGGEIKVDPLGPEFVNQASVAADGAKNFLIVWDRQNGANEKRVLARGANFETGFTGPAQTVSNPSLATPGALPALFDDGTGPIAWMTGATSMADLAVGRQVDRSGLPTGPIQDLFAEDRYSGITVTSAPTAGVATFLFKYPISGSAQGAVVRRFLLPPVCSDSGATVVQGKPLFIPISCTGPALEGAQQVGSPAHGRLSVDPAALGFTYTPVPGFAGTDSFTYTALNDGGVSNLVTVAIAVGKDTVKPRVKTLKLIRRGKAGKQRLKFRLAFSEPATAKLTLKRAVRAGGKTKLRKVGVVSSKQAAGKTTIAVKGKLARKLRAGGRFRAVAVATDPAGNRSAAKVRSFRVR